MITSLNYQMLRGGLDGLIVWASTVDDFVESASISLS